MKMKKCVLVLLFFIVAKFAFAQKKIDSIYFHLYTDSLKKGFYNYINIDGKTADGMWIPLSTTDVFLSANNDSALRFENNDLFIDSAYLHETVSIKAVLKSNPKICREIIIYIRKRGFDEPLKSNQEILDEYTKPQKKKTKS